MTDNNWLRDNALALVRQAVRAPSSHNTQPWRFRISSAAIDLYADRTRALPINDPHDRELTISCGCALLNLRVAAAHWGRALAVRLLPDPRDPDLLARVWADSEARAPSTLAELFPHIEGRQTYRKRFTASPVSAATIAQLVETAQAEQAWLRTLSKAGDREMLAQLVVEGDAAQWANRHWRHELAAWMHPPRRGDGLTVPALVGPLARLAVRSFDMGGKVGARDKALADSSPVLAVLGTARDAPADWLTAGQALERVLLGAAKLRLQASYLNQPVQLTPLRPKLEDLVGKKFAHIVLRLGYPADNNPGAPRRPVADVLANTA